MASYLSCGRNLLRPAVKPAQGTVVFAGPTFDLGGAQRPKLMAAKKGLKPVDPLPSATTEVQCDNRRLRGPADQGLTKAWFRL